MKTTAISLAVAFAILSLVASTALATTYRAPRSALESPADSIGREVKVYLKEWVTEERVGPTYPGEVFRQGILIKVTLKKIMREKRDELVDCEIREIEKIEFREGWYLVESDDAFYWIPVENVALIEVIK